MQKRERGPSRTCACLVFHCSCCCHYPNVNYVYRLPRHTWSLYSKIQILLLFMVCVYSIISISIYISLRLLIHLMSMFYHNLYLSDGINSQACYNSAQRHPTCSSSPRRAFLSLVRILWKMIFKFSPHHTSWHSTF